MSLMYIILAAVLFAWLLCGFIAYGFFYASISVSPALRSHMTGRADAAISSIIYGPIALWIAIVDFSDDGWRLW